MSVRNNDNPPSDGKILGISVGVIAFLSLLGWLLFPAMDRINDQRVTLAVLPGILRAVNLPAVQAQPVLTSPVRVGRGMVSAVNVGIIQGALDGDHSKVFWSGVSVGVCVGVKLYARQAPNDFSNLILTVPGHTWRDAKDIQATNCQSLPARFTLTIERRK